MNSLGADFATIYARELDRLASEINAYVSEKDLWSTIGAQKNPPGAIALHVVGAMLAKIGADLGNTGYVRDRDLEFSGRDIPRNEIIQRIDDCRDTIVPILKTLSDDHMRGPYPGKSPSSLTDPSTQGFLLHFLWHLGWHLGQIYYHRLGLMEVES